MLAIMNYYAMVYGWWGRAAAERKEKNAQEQAPQAR